MTAFAPAIARPTGARSRIAFDVISIVAGSLMVVTLSMGEFNITWMLHTPLTQTLPVGLADSYASMRLEIGSAYTIVFFFMIVPLLVMLQWLSERVAR